MEAGDSLLRDRRFLFLQVLGSGRPEALELLNQGGLTVDLASQLIEDAIGVFALPLGMVEGFALNEKVYTVPLVTEETSVVRALSKTVRWVAKLGGEVSAHPLPFQWALGQIQIPRVQNGARLREYLARWTGDLIEDAHAGPLSAMVKRGGGIQQIELRLLPRPDGGEMGVVDVFFDVQDAMGANLIVQTCEFLKPRIGLLCGERMGIAIVSNLPDRKCTQATVEISNVPEKLGKAIEEASLFAQLDPHRAVTHNKGILNGLDGVVMATGNDWRAVEAGLHGYAARSGQYRGLSTWAFDKGVLCGHFEGPISVGIKGGVTRVHPLAKLCLEVLAVKSAQELACVAAGVGLLQNLGALRALCSGGIGKGHMKLHLDNLLLAEGIQSESLRRQLREPLLAHLNQHGYVTSASIRALRADLETSE